MELGAAEVGFLQPRAEEVGPLEVGVAEVGPLEGGVTAWVYKSMKCGRFAETIGIRQAQLRNPISPGPRVYSNRLEEDRVPRRPAQPNGVSRLVYL